jgi:hypothetical protein
VIKQPAVVAQREWISLTAAQFSRTFDEQAKRGAAR